ncbi:40S ribosomal protein S21 [Entamoeba marina]
MATKQKTELYYPRHCSISHTLIAADDHAAVQIAVPLVDENGVIIPKQSTNYIVKGSIRVTGTSDHSLNRQLQKDGFLTSVVPKNMMI